MDSLINQYLCDSDAEQTHAQLLQLPHRDHTFTEDILQQGLTHAAILKHTNLVNYFLTICTHPEMAFLQAVQYGHLDVVQIFLNHGIDSRYLYLAMQVAGYTGNVDIVRCIRETEVNALLLHTAGTDKISVVEYCIAQGADVNFRQGEILNVAIQWGHIDIVRTLCRSGANVKPLEHIMLAIKNGRIDVLNYLLQLTGFSLDSAAYQIFLAAVEAGKTNVVKYLLDAELNIIPYANNKQALHIAVLRNDRPMVDLLLTYETYLVGKAYTSMNRHILESCLDRDLQEYLYNHWIKKDCI